MKPETLHTIQVRELQIALPGLDQLEVVQHHVSRTEIRRYLRLTDEQYWRIVSYIRETALVSTWVGNHE